MPTEVIDLLDIRPDGIYLDGTLGGGGHSELILRQLGPEGLLLAVDRDTEALNAATSRLSSFGSRFRPLKGSFGDMAAILASAGVDAVDGVLLDLGVSSHQLDCPERGFSFRADGPLDMRMDGSSGESAADFVNEMSAQELERVIKDYGEERWARKIAQRIVEARKEAPIVTTLQLASIVERTIPRKFQEDRIHPATRTFQALRIMVNGELEQLRQGLLAAIDLLNPCGRVVVISFHSLEDRIVKHELREAATGCRCPRQLPLCVCGNTPRVRLLTARPVLASAEEVQKNPRSRSAKVRAAEKLG
jgi:16S rRNA (cytosine1402-N4)-methyltransferase